MRLGLITTLCALAVASTLTVDQGKVRTIHRGATAAAGGGGGSLVSQGVHPRTGGLSSATMATIRTKLINNYDSTTSYADLKEGGVGTFQLFLDDLNSNFGLTANQTNALQWAHAYCLAGHLMNDSGMTSAFTSTKTASQLGTEGARLAAAITSLTGVDGGFPQTNAPYAYDWCHAWLNSSDRATIRGAIDDLESDCDALYSSPFAADSNKTCSTMYAGAVAIAGDDGETWGTNHLTEWDSVMASNSTGIIGSESTVANLYKSAYGYGSCSSPGLAYMSYMWQYDLLAAETYRFGATTQTPSQFYDLTKYSFLPSGIYCLTYLLRPYARTTSGVGDANNLDWKLMRTQYAGTDQQDAEDAIELPPAVFAGIWNSVETAPAQLAMWFQRQRRTYQSASGASRLGRQWVYRFTMEDPTITESGPDDLSLPLSARMGDGSYWFRSAWDGDASTNANWVIKLVLPAFSVPGDGREAMNMSGAIEVHRKGAQLIWRGAGAHVPIVHGGANTLYFYNTGRTTDWNGSSSGSDPWNSTIDGRPLGWTNQPQPTSRGADIVQGGSKDYLNSDASGSRRAA